MESKKNLYPVRKNLKGKTRFEGLLRRTKQAGERGGR